CDPDHSEVPGSRFKVLVPGSGSRFRVLVEGSGFWFRVKVLVVPEPRTAGTGNFGTWNLEPGTCELFFFYRADLAPAIVAAVRADTVRQLRLVALRALGQACAFEGVVRPALRGSRLGVSSFWVRHGRFSLLGTRCSVLGSSKLLVLSSKFP